MCSFLLEAYNQAPHKNNVFVQDQLVSTGWLKKFDFILRYLKFLFDVIEEASKMKKNDYIHKWLPYLWRWFLKIGEGSLAFNEKSG